MSFPSFLLFFVRFFSLLTFLSFIRFLVFFFAHFTLFAVAFSWWWLCCLSPSLELKLHLCLFACYVLLLFSHSLSTSSSSHRQSTVDDDVRCCLLEQQHRALSTHKHNMIASSYGKWRHIIKRRCRWWWILNTMCRWVEMWSEKMIFYYRMNSHDHDDDQKICWCRFQILKTHSIKYFQSWKKDKHQKRYTTIKSVRCGEFGATRSNLWLIQKRDIRNQKNIWRRQAMIKKTNNKKTIQDYEKKKGWKSRIDFFGVSLLRRSCERRYVPAWISQVPSTSSSLVFRLSSFSSYPTADDVIPVVTRYCGSLTFKSFVSAEQRDRR